VGDTLAVTLPVLAWEPLGDTVDVDDEEPESVRVPVTLPVAARLRVWLPVSVADPVRDVLSLGVWLPVAERDPVEVGNCDDVGVLVALLVLAWEPLGVGVEVGVGEVVSLGDVVCEPVRLRVAEALPAWEAVAVVVAVVEADTLPPERDLVWVTDGVALCDRLGVALDVRVPEGLETCELVSDGVGLRVTACVRVEPGDCTWLEVTPRVRVEL